MTQKKKAVSLGKRTAVPGKESGRERDRGGVELGETYVRKSRVGNDDAAKGDDEEEEDRHEDTREEFVGRKAGNRVPEADVINFEQHEHEPGVCRVERRRAAPHGAPPPAHEVDGAREHRVGQLDEHGADGERDPRVDFRVGFARLVEGAELEELGLQLLDEWGGDGEGEEDGEEAGLEVDLGVAEVVEGEGVEETGGYLKKTRRDQRLVDLRYMMRNA